MDGRLSNIVKISEIERGESTRTELRYLIVELRRECLLGPGDFWQASNGEGSSGTS